MELKIKIGPVCRLGILLCLTIFAPALQLAHAGGGSTGGGDICENRIKEIRTDLTNWIEDFARANSDDSPNSLTLPKGMKFSEYAQAMKQQMSSATFKCVGPGDAGYPVRINETPKVCVWTMEASGKGNFTCDFLKYNSLRGDEQYVLTHHEYAGLAQIEPPNGDDSNYDISNQISDFLTEMIVTKLQISRLKMKYVITRHLVCVANSRNEQICKNQSYTWYQDNVEYYRTHIEPVLVREIYVKGNQTMVRIQTEQDIINESKLTGLAMFVGASRSVPIDSIHAKSVEEIKANFPQEGNKLRQKALNEIQQLANAFTDDATIQGQITFLELFGNNRSNCSSELLRAKPQDKIKKDYVFVTCKLTKANLPSLISLSEERSHSVFLKELIKFISDGHTLGIRKNGPIGMFSSEESVVISLYNEEINLKRILSDVLNNPYTEPRQLIHIFKDL